MTSQEYVLDAMRRTGRAAAEALQAAAPQLTGTEINARSGYLPDFDPTKQYRDYQAGYVCRSKQGRAVRLIQPYDSVTYTQEPEELSAQWGYYWSTDPAMALPFIQSANSPYNTGDCCTHAGRVWRSGMDGNVHAPGSVGAKWEDLGPVGAVSKSDALEERRDDHE